MSEFPFSEQRRTHSTANQGIGGAQRARQHGTGVAQELKEPSLYAVLLHNDDFTTMDFVVSVLMRVFQKSAEDAAGIMLNVHTTGEGVAGIYPFDIAVTKKLLAERMAEERNYPLRITVAEARK